MKRRALFIGVNEYEDPQIRDLNYSLSDAHALKTMFELLGYQSDILENPSKSDVFRAVKQMTADLSAGDLFFFYFAGHGWTTTTGKHLLFCTDDMYEDLRDDDAGISFDKLKRKTSGDYNRAFVLDACRSDFITGKRGEDATTRDLRPIGELVKDAPSRSSLAVLRSCSQYEHALEIATRKHGLFTLAMMDVVRTARESGNELVFGESLCDAVTEKMIYIAREEGITAEQTPEFAKSGVAQVLIEGRKVASHAREPPPPISPVMAPVACPECGMYNEITNTFKCKVCGRDHLCKDHFSKEEKCCLDCAAKVQARRAADERARREAEEKARLAAHPKTGNLKTLVHDGVELNTATKEESQGAVNDTPTIGSFSHGSPIQVGDCFGKVIGGFKVIETIQTHAGAQGTVYKAKCVADVHGLVPVGTLVALKVMAVQDEDKNIWCRIVKRTNELAHLNHPSVVKYFGCFSEQGTFTNLHVVVQEFLSGETLKDRLARHPSGLDADEAVMIVESVLSGLSCISSHGIVHRDVKPGNIFVCLNAKGGVEAVKLIDFELANQMHGSTTTKTPPSNIIGSLDYMAPDFIDSKFHGDVQSDVFSIGIVFHEALTGKMPYQHIEGEYARAIFLWTSRWTHALSDGESPIKIHGRVKRLLAHADEVLSRALAIRREHRYGDFDEFRADLKTIRYRQLTSGQNVYRLLQFIGRADFGEVFKARHMQTGRLVAIKHLLKTNYADRFHREAKILKKVDDPCFVRLIDSFAVNHAGSHEDFIVMEYLPGMPGSSLRDAIKRENGAALPFCETLLAFARFAHGLSVLHALGIMHRDIKPSHLYYPKGYPERVAIMGLAIARDMSGTVTSGQVPGTLDYMPPEVVITDNRGGPGADIYALGLCLYEALTGKPAYPRLPLGAAAYSAFFARATNMLPPDLSDPIIAKNAPLNDLLVQMTHPVLSKRLVDAREVERRLGEIANDECKRLKNTSFLQ